MGLRFYLDSDGSTNSLLIGVYVFILALLSGFFGAFPGGTKVKNEYGDLVKTGSVHNLSNLQSTIILLWAIGMGSYLVYIIEFKSDL